MVHRFQNMAGTCERVASDLRFGGVFSPCSLVSFTTHNWLIVISLNVTEKVTIVKFPGSDT